MRAEQEVAAATLQTRENELERLRKDGSELVRLRGDVAALRRQASETRNREAQQPAQQRPEKANAQAEIASSAIRFVAVNTGPVLAIYAEVAGVELDVDTRVTNSSVLINYENTEPLTRAQAVEALESVLQHHGIVVERATNNRAVVRLSPPGRTPPPSELNR